MTALDFKPLTRQVLDDRIAYLRTVVESEGWPAENAPAVLSFVVCDGCDRHLDLTEDEPVKWSTASTDAPMRLKTAAGETTIVGWIDLCAMCKLRRRLDDFRTAIRGSPPAS